MSEREKDIMKTISTALPNMSDFEKGYLLGVAESRAEEKKTAAQKQTEKIKAVSDELKKPVDRRRFDAKSKN